MAAARLTCGAAPPCSSAVCLRLLLLTCLLSRAANAAEPGDHHPAPTTAASAPAGATAPLGLSLGGGAAGGTPLPLPQHAGLFALRRAGLLRWEAERATDYLAQIEDPDDRRAAEEVCGAVGGAEERWMCGKRASRLAARMKPYVAGVSRAASDRLLEEHNPDDGHGARVFIVAGRIHRWEVFNAPEEGLRRSGFTRCYVTALLGVMLEGVLGGTTLPNQTFDVVVLFGDASRCRRSAPSSFNSPAPPVYPVVTYSVSASGCPRHIPLPWVSEVVQDHRNTRPALPWDALRNAALLRGKSWNAQRIYLAMLSAAGAVPGLDVRLQMSALGDTNATCNTTTTCHRVLSEGRQAGVLPSDASPELCLSNSSMWTKRAMAWDDMRESRYLLAVDGYGATGRFPNLLRSPGVVLGLTIEYEESYFPDVIPFVHYVPLAVGVPEIHANLTHTLGWLEAHPETARAISDEAGRWATLHKTRLTDQREWKLFFRMMSHRWEKGTAAAAAAPSSPLLSPSSSRRPARHMPLRCTFFRGSVDAGSGALTPILQRLWGIACNAAWGGEGLTGELRCERHASEWLDTPLACRNAAGGGGVAAAGTLRSVHPLPAMLAVLLAGLLLHYIHLWVESCPGSRGGSAGGALPCFADPLAAPLCEMGFVRSEVLIEERRVSRPHIG